MAVPKSAVAPTKPAEKPAAANALLAAMQAPPTEDLGAVVRIAYPITPAFFLMHSPTDWEARAVNGEVDGVRLDGVYWLPVLAKLPEVPGSTPGMRTRKRGESPEASYADAVDRRRRGGWAVLDRVESIAPAYLPAGIPAGPYIRRMACRDPQTGRDGYAHVEAWHVPVRTSPGRKQAFKFDFATYDLWRASLVLRGVVDPPTEDVTAPQVSRARSKVSRIAALPLPDEVRRDSVGKARTKADALAGAQALA
jgi:hypothetical protein